jgi:transaldolase/glucose-6-phosphate isomerase
MNALFELSDSGQSYWLDNLSREMIRSGELRRRVEEQGLRGVTSNPAIFHKAISGGDQYDEEIARLVATGASIPDIYEQLVVSDISEACDVLRPVFEETDGLDGYVSLEVSPRLIHDTGRSIEEGRRLWSAVGRPNLMIKIPGTPAGIPAIEELLFEGINVNVTLLFDVPAYDQVAQAYIRALTRRVEAGKSPVVASVASFFLSRIDVLVDGLIGHRIDAQPGPSGPAALLGHAGIASAKLAYRSFQQHFSGPSWSELAESGARVQRLLWASTSSKNPLYDAVRYVEPLIGRATVNTMPESTIEAFSLSGCAIPDTIEAAVDDAAAVFERLDAAGIDMVAVARQLVDEGAEKFIAPFDALLAGLATKRSELAGDADRFALSSAARDAMSPSLLSALAESRFVRRLFAADPSLWSRDGDVQTAIEARLGWLDSPRNSLDQLSGFEDLVNELREEGMEHVVVLGMGGSGLGAAVAADTFEPVEGYPQLVVLDDIDPSVVRDLESRIAIDRTLFVVASKSGTTVETLALYRHFLWRVTEAGVANPGSRFVALTDAESPLSREAAEAGFRTVIETPENVGGRFSVLAPFGVVPMALAGLDASGVLAAALRQRAASTPEVPIAANPSIGLGVALGALAGAGRTKVTFLTSPSVQRLEDWLEQLIAESTGKDGQGIIPIIGEPARPTDDYEPDRVFVRIALDGEPQPEVDARLASLEAAGHPVVRLRLPDKTAIGAEFYRWELAVASASALLGVNPFDEPDVADAKRRALQQLAELGGQASVDVDPVAADGGLELFVTGESELAGNGVGDRIRRWVDETSAGDYVAILAYFGASETRNQLASRLRDIVGQRTGAATTFGYGPRYLHSTGQLHKGGLPGGSFLVLTTDEPEDIVVPGEPYGFAQLRLAQATGDAEALRDRGRRVVRINLGWFVDEALHTLSQVLAKPDSHGGRIAER